jgi:hypothetical protein
MPTQSHHLFLSSSASIQIYLPRNATNMLDDRRQEQKFANEQKRFIYSVEYLIVFQREGHTKLTCKEVCIFMFYKFSCTKESIFRNLQIYFGYEVKQYSATLVHL